MPSVAPPAASQLCICQICTCGRHRCPHNPGASTIQLGQNGDVPKLSEYNQHFKDGERAPREPLRRAKDQIALPTDRLEDITTSRSTYAGQPNAPRPQAIRAMDNLRPQGDLDMGTSYKDEFNQKSVPRNQPRAARSFDNLATSSAKFDAQPSYKEDYPGWSTERAARVRQSDRPNGIQFGLTGDGDGGRQFEGNTTLRSDYRGLPGERARLMKPQTAPLMGSHDGTDVVLSTTRENYRPWEVTRPSLRKQESYVRPDGAMELSTTHQNDFMKRDQPVGERAKALIPSTVTKLWTSDDLNTPKMSTQKEAYKGVTGERAAKFQPTVAALQTDPNGLREFDGSTTQRSDYKGHDSDGDARVGGRRRHWLQETYARPEGDIDFQTTTKSDFKNGMGEPRIKGKRPVTTQRMSGQFDGTTSHSQDYPKWLVDHRRQRPAEQKAQYRPPSGKFDGQTTNRSDFAGHSDFSDRFRLGRPAPNANPLVAADGTGAPLEGTTSYHSQYVAHSQKPCPAEGLQFDGAGNDRFRFKVKLGGHHFYAPSLISV